MKFPAEHFEPANMIAVFVGEEHTIELPRRDSALLEPDHDLSRAESAIDQDPAMIGRDQGAIPRAAAAEHGQSEHARLVADAGAFHKLEMELARKKCVSSRGAPSVATNAPEAPSTKIQAPKKHQYSNIKSRSEGLGAWCLLFLWSLVLGIWS